jgi:hypothetical protein
VRWEKSRRRVWRWSEMEMGKGKRKKSTVMIRGVTEEKENSVS